MLLTAGDKLGPYQIIEPLGEGGMGEVWKARDTRLNRTVAIKKSHNRFTERFEREAHAIAALNHPHICSLYDVGPDFLVMEYVEGKPLKGPLPLNEALAPGGQILDALDTAHLKGVTHRDLKPGNILLNKNGVKVLDFGLAKIERRSAADSVTETVPLTNEGTILGTLQYMSPEQVEGKEADARSDIFAFGLVLYELTVWALWPKPPVPVKSTRFQVPLPENEDFVGAMALSPDGRKLAFNTMGRQPGLWIRDLDTLESRHLAGTEGPSAPIWSPDSRFIAFGAGGQLKKIEVSGGPPQKLCDAPPGVSGSWSRDGVIIFGSVAQGAVRRVSASGGVPAELTAVDRQRGEVFHRGAWFLPDGRHFLYDIEGAPEISGIYAESLDAKPEEQKRERLLATRFGALYTPSQDAAGGRLFFMRDTTLMAQPFDAARLQLTGEPVAVAERVEISGNHGLFSISPSGVLAYRTGAPAAGFQLTWFDRQGKTQGTFGELSSDQGVALSGWNPGSGPRWSPPMRAEISGRSTSRAESARGSRSANLRARFQSGPEMGVASLFRPGTTWTLFTKSLRAARAMRKSC